MRSVDERVAEVRGRAALLVVRGDFGAAESVIVACERLIGRTDWEPYADAGEYWVVGIVTAAPETTRIKST